MTNTYTKKRQRRDIAEIGRILHQDEISEEDANEARGMLECILETRKQTVFPGTLINPAS